MLRWPKRRKLDDQRKLYRVSYCDNGIPYYTPALAKSKREAMETVRKGLKGVCCSITKVEEIKR